MARLREGASAGAPAGRRSRFRYETGYLVMSFVVLKPTT
jgi:hypothetical protein